MAKPCGGGCAAGRGKSDIDACCRSATSNDSTRGAGGRADSESSAFFECTGWECFTPRSLDVDVIYELMIHDLDILLALVKQPVTEVKAVGIPSSRQSGYRAPRAWIRGGRSLT